MKSRATIWNAARKLRLAIGEIEYPYIRVIVWLPYGYRILIVWLSYGYRMVIVWLSYGNLMIMEWIYNKPMIIE